MPYARTTSLGFALLLIPFPATRVDAAAGTVKVATTGQPAHVSPNWPAGVGPLVNDPVRADGWNDWFSGWPNDVNHYGYQVTGMGDVNELIRKLAAVKGESRQVLLSPLKEPLGLGWVTRLPEGNNVGVTFSIGDQQQLDKWFGRLPDGKFGVIQFEAAPIAVPPTLTIFVGNDKIDLDRLEIPQGIDVSAGYCPRLFHKANTQRERARQNQQDKDAVANEKPVDKATQQALDRINQFLKGREERETIKEQVK